MKPGQRPARAFGHNPRDLRPQGAGWLRDPLVAFVLIGLAIFLTHTWLNVGGDAGVILTAEMREGLINRFEAVTGREPDPADIEQLEREYVLEQLLVREAIAQGLHLRSGDIRRELVAEMRMAITGMLPDPTDEQLVNHYAENLTRYHSEPTVTFRHVFFATAPADPDRVLRQLRAGARPAGDPFAQGADFAAYGQSMVRGLFGSDFTTVVWAQPVGTWAGPLRSTRGWHYVLVEGTSPAELLGFDEVRHQVENDYLVAVIESAVSARAAELEEKYGVMIER